MKCLFAMRNRVRCCHRVVSDAKHLRTPFAKLGDIVPEKGCFIMEISQTRKIVIAALMAALSGILAGPLGFKVAIGGIYSQNISFGVVPIIFAGILLGPLYAGIAGGIADILKAVVLSPAGAYTPFFTITYILVGVIPGLLARKMKTRPGYIKVLGIVAVTQIICSMGLNSFFMIVIFNAGGLAILPPRIITQVILIPVFAVLIHLFITASEYSKTLPRFSSNNANHE